MARPRKLAAVKPILNISAYKFAGLNDTAGWRESIRSQAMAFDLKGTVLLADEGINLFVAGIEVNVRAFLAWLAITNPDIGCARVGAYRNDRYGRFRCGADVW